tara:strand:+ start:406 stop:822 length:417 start_codon:yes stop_codon:yes gene_type:complete
MISIKKNDFSIEKEIEKIKSQHSNIGAISSFTGYVRNINNKKKVKNINLEVYKEMAIKELKKISNTAIKKWNLVDTLIIHRYGKLKINEKIVLVACFAKHRKESLESCGYIMDYLKKDAPFWKKEFYKEGSSWLENIK